jgi:hypothetical protein
MVATLIQTAKLNNVELAHHNGREVGATPA